MKKLLIGLLGMMMMMGIVACGNIVHQKHDKEGQAVEQQQKRAFRLPEVPAMLQTPELRAKYVALHYWDHFDFRDTAYIRLPDITEQAAVDYMDLLQHIPQEEALQALTVLVEKASVEKRMMGYLWSVLSRYWHEPNSPMKNEDMFILLCKGVEQNEKVEGYLREKAAYQRQLAEKNRPGTPAADFVYTLASGKQGSLYGLKAPYTLMFFYDPDCETCSEIKAAMKRSQRLQELVARGQVKVLTVYPDEEVELWRKRLPEMAKEWINAYDKEQKLTLEQRYDLTSIPSFYLLDKDKKVLLKDADWGQVLQFFEK